MKITGIVDRSFWFPSLPLHKKMKESFSSSPKIPDSPVSDSLSRSSLQLHSLSSALPPPSSSSPEAQPTPGSIRQLDVKDTDVESDEALWRLYERWMIHCKVSRSLDEKQKRFATFKEHVKFIHSENKTDNYPYELKLNKSSDMTTEEFDSLHTAMNIPNFKHLDIKDSDFKSDKTLKHLYKLWMARYRVSRSPNERLRRFAAFKEQVEYIHSENKKDSNLYKLGLNQFSDMTIEEFESKDMGASPVETLQMYNKVMEEGGLLSNDDFNKGRADAPKLTFDGYVMVTPNDEEALEQEVNKHPIVAYVDSRGNAFKNYRGGVLTEEAGKELLLAVNIVGYGVTPYGVKYWVAQSGLGATWGEGGFMRIKRGVNLRGIVSFATYPIINKPSMDACCFRGAMSFSKSLGSGI